MIRPCLFLFLNLPLFASQHYSIHLESYNSIGCLKEKISRNSVLGKNFFILQHSSDLYSSYAEKSISKTELQLKLGKYTDIFKHAYIEKIESDIDWIKFDMKSYSDKLDALNIFYKLTYKDTKLVSNIIIQNNSAIEIENIVFSTEKKVLYKEEKIDAFQKVKFSFLNEDINKYILLYKINNNRYKKVLSDIINPIAKERVYFLFGRTKMYDDSIEKLNNLKKNHINPTKNYLINIKAHTDSVPVKNIVYKNNLNLSYYRALKVQESLEFNE